jgi:hypothetical protein
VTAGETDLPTLLRALHPELHPECFVFAFVNAVPPGLTPFAVVSETEGLTVVVPQRVADELGLTYEFPAALVTLRVHSSLSAVGLTAAVTTVLAEHGISCNVIAGGRHDHLFVPFDRGAEVLVLLQGLTAPRPRAS